MKTLLLLTFSFNLLFADAPHSMEPKEVMGMLLNDFAVIVDVREAKERTETIAKARWIPHSKIEASNAEWKDFLSKLPKSKTIVFHCVAGSRAEHAAELAAAQGFKTGYFEGVGQWKAAGYPVKKAEKP